MAKKPIGLGVEITGDAKGFQKTASQVKDTAKEMKRNIGDASGAFTEFGNTIGGVIGDVTNSLISLITSGGPIAMVTAAIGGIAIAWEKSQKNLDLYLKTADKLKYGFAGYNIDANTERKLTRERAQGQITAGQTALTEANRILAYQYSTKAQKDEAQLMKEQAIYMIEQGRALRDQVMGVQDKITWQLKYNKLLQEQETLSDGLEDKQIEWEGLEAQIAKYKEIIANKDSTSAQKTKAVAEAESIITQLVKDKVLFLDKIIKNTEDLSAMTGTQEEVESKIKALLKEKNTTTKEYYQDLLKIDKLENRVANSIRKQIINREEGVNKIGIRDSSHAIIAGLVKGETGKSGISPFEGVSQLNTGLGIAQNAVNELSQSFKSLFLNVGGGFKSMVNAMSDSLKMLFAQLIGKAALFGILQLLFPGSGVAVGALTNLRKFIGIPGFASGTNFAPGGLSLVGERGPELVNLPRGSQIIPNIGGAMRIEGQFKIAGRDLYLVLNRYQRELSTNT